MAVMRGQRVSQWSVASSGRPCIRVRMQMNDDDVVDLLLCLATFIDTYTTSTSP